MKVCCTHEIPTEEEARQLRDQYRPGREKFLVEQGEEYLVYGMRIQRGQPWVDLEYQTGFVFPAPLLLFDIIDPRVSRFWLLGTPSDGGLLLWPQLFYERFFHDDLLEGVPQVVAAFEDLKQRMQREFGSQ